MKIRLKNTKLIDEYKRPVLFYHISPVDEINRFFPLSHFGTKKSAEMRGMHYIYQALGIQEPENLPNQLPENLLTRLSKSKNAPRLFTYPVYLYSKSTLGIPDLTKHSLEHFYNWFVREYAPKSKFLTGKERLEGDAIGETKTAYKRALSEFIFIAPFQQSKEDLGKELAADSLYSPITTNKSSLFIPSFLISAKENLQKIPFDLAEKVALGRMIHFFEGEGYDSFSYKNTYEDINQTSYIIFRPEQIFKANSFEKEHSFPTPDFSLLNKIEEDFFKKYNFLSPHQRIKNHQTALQQKIRKTH